jgi:hypothetical protein
MPDEEQAHDARRREASLAASIAAVLMVLMTGLTVLAVINLWPLFKAAPVPSANANVPE